METGEASSSSPPPLKGKILRILLVDDEEISLRVIAATLKWLGHEVESATNGADAIEMATKGSYDVVIMDLSLPQFDGLEATKLIFERLGAEKRPRVIGMTGAAFADDERRCLDLGMVALLIKPLEAEKIRALLA